MSFPVIVHQDVLESNPFFLIFYIHKYYVLIFLSKYVFHPRRETYENERTKLIQQAQQLSVDLEQARENLALKSRDNLKLQEEVRIFINLR